MIKLTTLIKENITIEDVVNSATSRWKDREAKIVLSIIEDYFYSEEPDKQRVANEYIELLNQVFSLGVKIAENLKVPFVNLRILKDYLLSVHEFKTKVEDFFPLPLYIAATKNADGDWGEIGVVVDQNGKVLEIHEGNDESSPETIAFVNKLVNPSGKKVRIYAIHNTELCRKIEMSEYMPPNLYVSPDRGHASRHWDNTDRSMFTGIVNINDLSQESDLDWKTVGNTKIEKFRWL